MIFLLKLIPKRLISLLVGILSDIALPKWFLKVFIDFFIKKYNINKKEMIYPVSYYKTFNDFFTRPINLDLRPIDKGLNSIVYPVDSRIIEFGSIKKDRAIQAKGIDYSIFSLISNYDYAKLFIDGFFITLYLSPKDYHRIHSPLDGEVSAVEYNRGMLYPVNSLGLKIPSLFAINERLTTFLKTDFGLCAIIKVGALNVGRISVNYAIPDSIVKKQSFFCTIKNTLYKKGEEFAKFEMGSTVVLLFENNRIAFDDNIKKDDAVKIGKAFAYGIS